MYQPQRLALALSFFAFAVAPACYVGKDGHVNKYNNLIVSYPLSATADQAIAAAREVAREMSLTEVTFSSSREEGWLVATDASDVVYEFRTTANDDRSSSIDVRVGTTGDREKSRAIIERVKAKL